MKQNDAARRESGVRPPAPEDDLVHTLEVRERRSRRFALVATTVLVLAVLGLFGALQRAVWQLQFENNRLTIELKLLNDQNIELRRRCGP